MKKESMGVKRIVNKSKKTIAVFGAIGAFLGLGFQHSSAGPIWVIDSKNIAQQIKTYSETVKVVSNTAQQIILMKKELKSLPNSLLNRYKNEVSSQADDVRAVFDNVGGVFKGAENVKTQWQDDMTKITLADIDTTISAAKNAENKMLDTQYQDHLKIAAAFSALNKELDKRMNRIQEIMDQSRHVEGNKQAQQLANQLAAEEIAANNIKIKILAMTETQKFKEVQAEVVRKQNEAVVKEAQDKANDDSLKRMKANTVEKMNYYKLGF